MTDTSIRRLTLAEEAEAHVRWTLETGEVLPNPHAGTAQEAEFAALHARWHAELTAPEGVEGTC